MRSVDAVSKLTLKSIDSYEKFEKVVLQQSMIYFQILWRRR